MVKKVYSISGFDCPHCAAAVEKYLSTREKIEIAKLDFEGEQLEIEYKEKAYSVHRLKKVIKEVEGDKLKTLDMINFLNYNQYLLYRSNLSS